MVPTEAPRTAQGAPGTQPVPDVRLRRLMGVCAWALCLAVCGLILGLIDLILILGGKTPGWFEPAIVVTGLVGLGLAIAAFPMTRARQTPWLLLASSTVVFVTGIVLTAQAS
ncbi:hypothetical protein Afil01_09480 [Actinorhabdospora filicis]|uniref:Uncharacterized protein n=2 Tax=Actinorhabdospora filicis TaxID=1785913 RepID=A0A9W6SIH8_9ACTN|nr:hypothetical protein Afil01_09480 [Actinorhabdospora filicis]